MQGVQSPGRHRLCWHGHPCASRLTGSELWWPLDTFTLSFCSTLSKDCQGTCGSWPRSWEGLAGTRAARLSVWPCTGLARKVSRVPFFRMIVLYFNSKARAVRRPGWGKSLPQGTSAAGKLSTAPFPSLTSTVTCIHWLGWLEKAKWANGRRGGDGPIHWTVCVFRVLCLSVCVSVYLWPHHHNLR